MDGRALERAVAHDRELLRTRLRVAFARPDLRDALFVASPGLEEALGKWIADPDGTRGRKIEPRLVRYFARAAGRPTPFGLFAGHSMGKVAENTRLELAGADTYRRHSRLDMDYLHTLAERLVREPELRASLLFRPNSSLYRAAARVRYVESRVSEGGRTHHLVAVEPSEHLDAALERAVAGATRHELAEAVSAHDVTYDDAAAYVEDLIDSQVVLPELAPPVTGPEPMSGLRDQLATHSAECGAAGVLDTARAELEALDGEGLGADPSRYRRIAAHLERLPADVELGRLFQVDMTKPAPEATLGRTVLEELARGVELLARIGRTAPSRDELDRIRDALLERYEERPVPLMEALDDEVGVGAAVSDGAGGDAEPLLRDLALAPSGDEEARWAARDRFLLRKLTDAAARGESEIALDRGDLDELAVSDARQLPDAFAVVARVAAESDAALDRGEFCVLLQGLEGPSGARLLGRFCHADPDLRKHVERHLRAEEQLVPDALFAEIVHLPEGRMGNILARPVLRGYEIPYLGRSGAPEDRRVPTNDLVVAVEGGRIVLRSTRLGRRVVPRLTTAHNFGRRSVPVYRLLCLLQQQGVMSRLGFDWGPLRGASFLPRVTSGRLVLAPACWRLAGEELQRLGRQRGSELVRAVRSLRTERGIPRLASLADADNVLPLDLENVLSLESLLQLVKNRDDALLVERFGDPDTACVRGPDGRFVHELVVPFTRAVSAAAPGLDGSRRVAARPSPRTLPPGSEWLYAKLYTGRATADRVLLDAVAPLVDEVLASGDADRWFFIRYADPDFHLRLRLHGEPAALHDRVLPRLEAVAAELLAAGMIWRFQLDTYEREVERYGGPEGVLLAERVFHVDSDAVVETLALLEPGDAGADERWRMGLAGSAALVRDLGLDEVERLALWRGLRDRFGEEFEMDQAVRRQLGARLRTEWERLEPLLEARVAADHPLARGFDVLERRSERLAPLFVELRSLHEAERLSIPPADLAGDYVHMHLNRLLRSANRAQEVVIYDFLARLHEARAARRRSSEPR